jgi:anti-anti-sigma regulatory factor
MSRVPFVDARCLAMLDTLAAMAAARGGELVVLQPTRPVVRVLRLTGVDHLVCLDGVAEDGRSFSG